MTTASSAAFAPPVIEAHNTTATAHRRMTCLNRVFPQKFQLPSNSCGSIGQCSGAYSGRLRISIRTELPKCCLHQLIRVSLPGDVRLDALALYQPTECIC